MSKQALKFIRASGAGSDVPGRRLMDLLVNKAEGFVTEQDQALLKRVRDHLLDLAETRLSLDSAQHIRSAAILLDRQAAAMCAALRPALARGLRQAMQQQNVRVTPGDVVVLHTGWLSTLPENPKRFGDEEPCIDGAGAELLASMQPCAVGADTWGVECVPFKDPNVVWQGHQILLAQNGIHILENLDTAALVRDGVSEFMFVLGAPRYRGAVQAIINPIAIR